MNSIKKMLVALFALVMTGTASSAGDLRNINLSDPFNRAGGGASGSQGGPYVSLQGAMYGATFSGSGKNSNSEALNDASLGQVFGSMGVNVGWAIPLGDRLLLGLDLSYQPGDGKIKVDTGAGDTDTTGEDVEVTAGNTRGISIMPMIAISDSSALYFKYGVTHVDLTWNDEMTAGIASSMLADTLAVGSRTVLNDHLYMQTEFGVSDFDPINIHTVTSGSTGTASAENVYGAFSVGIKF
tara:strand:+ start:286 stop:1005 length:720 start_codon:yes stop_codon:yes gene_type:complete